MLFGLLALTGSTVLLQIGSGISTLILGRLLQGVSAAVVWTVGLALLVDTVGQREIGMAMGWVGTSVSTHVVQIHPYSSGNRPETPAIRYFNNIELSQSNKLETEFTCLSIRALVRETFLIFSNFLNLY